MRRPIEGPFIPRQSHTIECWPLPRDMSPPEGQCKCPLVTGHVHPSNQKGA